MFSFNLFFKSAIAFSSILFLPRVFIASTNPIETVDKKEIALLVSCLKERVILSHENSLYGPSLIYDHTKGTSVDNPSLF